MFDGLTEYSAYVFTVLNSKRIYSSTVDSFSKFGIVCINLDRGGKSFENVLVLKVP